MLTLSMHVMWNRLDAKVETPSLAPKFEALLRGLESKIEALEIVIEENPSREVVDIVWVEEEWILTTNNKYA
jgi:hypothetical protein